MSESEFEAFRVLRTNLRALSDEEPVRKILVTSSRPDEGKTAVVFVHGWCCDHTVWRDQAAAFHGQARLLFIDLPGYGKSDKPKTDYTLDLFAKGIDAVLRDAGVEHAVPVGHSMGTPVVRQFYRLYPAKTKALVFVDGALRPFAKDPAEAEKFLSRFKEDTFKQDFIDMAHDLREQISKVRAA